MAVSDTLKEVLNALIEVAPMIGVATTNDPNNFLKSYQGGIDQAEKQNKAKLEKQQLDLQTVLKNVFANAATNPNLQPEASAGPTGFSTTFKPASSQDAYFKAALASFLQANPALVNDPIIAELVKSQFQSPSVTGTPALPAPAGVIAPTSLAGGVPVSPGQTYTINNQPAAAPATPDTGVDIPFKLKTESKNIKGVPVPVTTKEFLSLSDRKAIMELAKEEASQNPNEDVMMAYKRILKEQGYTTNAEIKKQNTPAQKFTPDQEQMISANMAAYGKPRDVVINALKKKGYL